jgi:hypothetical protein
LKAHGSYRTWVARRHLLLQAFLTMFADIYTENKDVYDFCFTFNSIFLISIPFLFAVYWSLPGVDKIMAVTDAVLEASPIVKRVACKVDDITICIHDAVTGAVADKKIEEV